MRKSIILASILVGTLAGTSNIAAAIQEQPPVIHSQQQPASSEAHKLDPKESLKEKCSYEPYQPWCHH